MTQAYSEKENLSSAQRSPTYNLLITNSDSCWENSDFLFPSMAVSLTEKYHFHLFTRLNIFFFIIIPSHLLLDLGFSGGSKIRYKQGTIIIYTFITYLLNSFSTYQKWKEEKMEAKTQQYLNLNHLQTRFSCTQGNTVFSNLLGN